MAKQKFYQGSRLTRRDNFQVAAFRTHFKINRRAGIDSLTALANAIVATSDEATSRVLSKHPDAVQQWMMTNKGGRRTLQNARNNNNNK